MSQQYDRSSKWLIQNFGGALLWLGGIRDVVSWKPLQAEVVQPRRLPDGLLEVEITGNSQPVPFLLELATYPEQRVSEQVLSDVAIVYLERRILPEMLSIVLQPKGRVRVAGRHQIRSLVGLTGWSLRWRVVELWKLRAEDALASDRVGVIPWVPLMRFSGQPERLLRECRNRIDRDAPDEQRENLLVVTQVLAGLRYNDLDLNAFFGGISGMLELPILKEAAIERQKKDILSVLEARFDAVPGSLIDQVQTIHDEDRLDELIRHAARARTLKAFERALRS